MRAILPGVAATMMGIGFARFSFTPLSAMFVEQQIITSFNVTVIAVAMMGGYFLGAVFASSIARKVGSVHLVRWCFVVVVIGLLVEGVALDYSVFVVSRFVTNFAGACLMVVGPSMVLSHVKEEQRSFAAAIVFTGVGAGIVIAGMIVSAAAALNGLIASAILSAVAGVMLVIGWNGWRVGAPSRPDQGSSANVYSAGYVGLLFAYGFEAIAFIPHTMFLSDYVSSELSLGAHLGGYFWAILGLGGLIGPFLTLRLRKVLGGQVSLELVLFIKACVIAIVAFSTNPVLIAMSAFIVGALVPGIVMLISTRTMELVGPSAMTKAWGVMTAVFAAGQFVGATGMSYGYGLLGSYQSLFAVAVIFQILGLSILIILTRFFHQNIES